MVLTSLKTCLGLSLDLSMAQIIDCIENRYTLSLNVVYVELPHAGVLTWSSPPGNGKLAN